MVVFVMCEKANETNKSPTNLNLTKVSEIEDLVPQQSSTKYICFTLT